MLEAKSRRDESGYTFLYELYLNFTFSKHFLCSNRTTLIRSFLLLQFLNMVAESLWNYFTQIRLMPYIKDQKMREDNKKVLVNDISKNPNISLFQNRLHDSIELFQWIGNNPLFQMVQIILFLNKRVCSKSCINPLESFLQKIKFIGHIRRENNADSTRCLLSELQVWVISLLFTKFFTFW